VKTITVGQNINLITGAAVFASAPEFHRSTQAVAADFMSAPVENEFHPIVPQA